MKRLLLLLLLLTIPDCQRDYLNNDWYWQFTDSAESLLVNEANLTPIELHELVMPHLLKFLPDYRPNKDGIAILFTTSGVPGKIGYCCRDGHPEVFMNGGFNYWDHEQLAWQVALVIAHELGHWRGLGHSDDPCSIMYPQAFGCQEPYWD